MGSSANRRVVVTGLGVVSPIGTGTEANWDALMNGRSGIGPITKFDASKLKTQIAGEVKDFKAEDFMDKKTARRVDVFIHYAVAAARMAMEHSGLRIGPDNADRVACILGCGLGGMATLEDTHFVLLNKGPDRISPFFIPGLIGNMAPGLISIEFGAKGPNLCISTACAAGTHAIGQAYNFIRSGICDAAITGGAEGVVVDITIGGFNAMKALSTRNDDPERASRPFDRDRDGFITSEGSGIVILEELEQARARGANILAEVIGFGMSSDAYHMVAMPEGGEGAARCMQAALDDAGMTAGDIHYINAHGTSTDLNDPAETKAIRSVFGDKADSIPVSSTKSMTGHLLGAAGGVEAVYSVLTIVRKVIPPTINYENPDPACDLDYVPNKARPADVKTVMSNSFGFGGTNGTLIFRALSE